MMVANEFDKSKSWVDLSEEELMQGLKTIAGVDIRQTSDEAFCRHIFLVLRIDAGGPVDSSRVFRQKRALRKYHADSRNLEVVMHDDRHYTLRYGKVLVSARPLRIEPPELRR